ncbi:MAG TPA: SGNH/GDSL hydrolase family protein [Ilumatobacteraceae bacterium]|nr:SGNH/GDSL hydrolase family protein [Ilumatobacteraceae bacterium]
MARPLRVAPYACAVAALAAVAGCRAGPDASGHELEAASLSTAPAVSTPDGTPPVAATATTTTLASMAAAETNVVPTTTIPPTPTPTITTATTATTTSLATATTVRPAATTTRCTTVAHIGDSTSVGLFEPTFMPDPADALPTQYERVGVLALYTEVSGGRSTIETIGGEENAFDTVLRLRGMGYRGCWVVTIGTNDAANVAIGGVPDLSTRLDRMMFLFGTDPVLWVDAVTNLDDGPYADINMHAWNDVLDAAEARFPTLRVFRWSDVALDEWFVPDGIHYTSGGAAWRSHAIADALVAAFPTGVP